MIFLLLGCGTKDKPSDASSSSDENAQTSKVGDDHTVITLTDAQQKNAGMTTEVLTQIPFTETLQVQGKLDVPPQYSAAVTSAMGGIVRKTLVLPGEHVRKGQTLLVLEHPNFVSLQQDFLETKNQLELAELELTRQKLLSAENVNAKRSLEQSTAQVQGLRISLQAKREKLSFIYVNPDKLTEQTISRSIKIPSPISGHVISVHAVVGMSVLDTDVLIELVETQHMHVEMAVYERDVQQLTVGQKMSFQIVGDAQKVRTGHIHLIGKQIRSDRTVLVHGHFDVSDPSLLPGSSVTATIHTHPIMTYALPTSAIVMINGHANVFQQTTNTEFVAHTVQVGAHNNTHTQLLGDVEDLVGKRIVVKGTNSITN
ncbi:MAG: efflux RND transporter periplasmic adaptor subunit [Ignavibacteria bacterium]|nr:efflux RND transporter periplasmic adaptor subunit [Ignavibacteria bacterium]